MAPSEEDEVGMSAFPPHQRLSNSLQSVSIPLITLVSTIFSSLPYVRFTNLSIDYPVVFWALHRLGAIST